MTIYRNSNATEGEITEITAEKDKQFGKVFYSVDCYYLQKWTAPNGSTGTTKGITTNFDKINKEEIINYFNQRINN